MKPVKYPKFKEPEKYMQCRVRRTPLGLAKTHTEQRALDRVLKGTTGVRTICDVPSGPGRLFPYWRRQDYRVHGVDVSEPMVAAARKMHEREGLEGSVGHGDAFNLAATLPETPDLVASIRFIYYFDPEKRVELLRSLAAASRRYVLTQYKTTETLRGQVTLVQRLEAGDRVRKRHLRQEACSHEQILEEVTRAGLVPLAIEPVGEFSDRVFVLAEKPEADPELRATVPPPVRMARSLRLPLATLLLVLLGIVYAINGGRAFWDEREAYWALGARAVMGLEAWLPAIAQGRLAADPPLGFWWTALVSALSGGVSEWSVRLANVLAAVAVLAAAGAFARRRFSRWSALLTVVLAGTTYEFWEQAVTANGKMLPLALLTAAWLPAARLLIGQGSGGRARAMFWLLAALLLLAQGPWGVLVLLVGVTIFAALEFRRGWWRELAARLRPWPWLGLALVPWAAWLALAWAQSGAEAALHAALAPFGRVQADLLEDLAEMPLSLMPWIILLPVAIWHHWRRRQRRRLRLRAETRLADDPQARLDASYRFGWAAIAGALALAPFSPDAAELALVPWLALLTGDAIWRRLCLLSTPGSDRCDERIFGGLMLGRRRGRLLTIGAGALVLALVFYSSVVMPLLNREKSPRPFLSVVSAAVDADDRLVMLDENDLRFVYYLEEPVEISGDRSEEIATLVERLRGPREVDVLVKARDLKEFTAHPDLELWVTGAGVFREEPYYMLSNEADAGATPLAGVPIREPSGMTWRGATDTFFVVGEEGDLIEIDRRGRLVRGARLGGDLEAVTMGPFGGVLYVADEEKDRILEVNVQDLKVVRRYELDWSRVEPRPEEGKGNLEGLCWLPGAGGEGRLFAVNQDEPAMLMEIALEPGGERDGRARIVRATELPVPDLAEMALAADGRTMLAFSNKLNELFEVNPEGAIGRRWHLPGREQEAIAQPADGSLYVAEGDTLLTIYPPGDRRVAPVAR